jgi:hypothetical protein
VPITEANGLLLLQRFSAFTTENGLWLKEKDEQCLFKRRRFEIRGGHFAF